MTNSGFSLLSDDTKPDWLIYPVELIELVRLGQVDLRSWRLIGGQDSLDENLRLKSRLDRDLIPFAHCMGSEDLACFEKGRGQKVLLIHDNTSPGWEDEGEYLSFADWLSVVKAGDER